jgi:hypothetical protein
MIFKTKIFAVLLVTGIAMIFGSTMVAAQDSEQLAAITALGSLNGIALQCGALGETQRIKKALVATLPKRRQLGELFDYETNRSFLAFMENNETCPSPQVLARQIDEALERLRSLYSVK